MGAMAFPCGPRAVAALSLATLLLVACSDSPFEPPAVPSDVAPVGSVHRVGVVGAALTDSLIVTVTDQNQRPIRGVTVSWATTSGALSASTASTSADGRSAVAWTLATAVGPATATATVAGLSPVTFSAEATAAATTVLTLTGPSAATAGDAQTYALTARDMYGNQTPDFGGTRTLVFTGADQAPDGTPPTVASQGGAPVAFGSNLDLVFEEGEATAVVVLYGAGHATVRAGAETMETNEVEVGVAPGPTAVLELSPTHDSIFATYTAQLEASTRDSWGNATAPVVTWASSGTEVAVDQNGLATGVAAGVATVTATTGDGVQGSSVFHVDEFVEVATGSGHTCGRTAVGDAYCWGSNSHGQVGIGATSVGWAIPVLVPGGHAWQQLSAGWGHTCGVTASGDAYCWGANTWGALGDGTTTSSSTPRLVVGGHAWAMVTAGNGHSCGVATTGQAYCWGYGGQGERGDDTYVEVATAPTPVFGGHVWAKLSAGGGTCGITTGGDAYCWGLGGFGQLGNGSTVDRIARPEPVWGGLTWLQIGRGYMHACGISSGGDAYCWGVGSEGQIGNGATDVSLIPAEVHGSLTWMRSVAGSSHSCGLTTGGHALCWGERGHGALGDGSSDGWSAVPVAASGERSWVALDAGSVHTCGITDAGAVMCWGYNEHGELGTGTENPAQHHLEPVRIARPMRLPAAGGWHR